MNPNILRECAQRLIETAEMMTATTSTTATPTTVNTTMSSSSGNASSSSTTASSSATTTRAREEHQRIFGFRQPFTRTSRPSLVSRRRPVPHSSIGKQPVWSKKMA